MEIGVQTGWILTTLPEDAGLCQISPIPCLLISDSQIVCDFQHSRNLVLSCGLQNTVVSSCISLDSCRIHTQKYTCYEEKIHVIEAIF